MTGMELVPMEKKAVVKGNSDDRWAILDDDGNVGIGASLEEWSAFQRDFDKKVIAKDDVKESCLVWLRGKKRRNLHVSTVFLGLDHGYFGTPLWFETMIFPADDSGDITDWCELWADRYTTIQEAREGHVRAVEIAKGGIRGDS